MKWGSLFLLVGLLALWAGLPPASGQLFLVKPGKCPFIGVQCTQIQWDSCFRDEECQGRQKCCFHPCGRRCLDPVPDDQQQGQGRCPLPPQGKVGPCGERCGINRTCPRGFGCCSTGCGHECKRLI